jgi:hypothetical protein
MDGNGDGTITRQEWNGSAVSFRIHDWNNDGVLSGDEIRAGMSRPDFREDARIDGEFRAVPSWSRQAFVDLDQDRNGRLSVLEWPYEAEIFRRVDRNGDRSVTLAEFTASVDDDRDDIFANLDTNQDGYLSGLEWHGSADTFEWLDRDDDRRLSRAEVIGGDDIQAPQAASEVRVPASTHWVDSGISVKAGDRLTIRGTGEIQWTGRTADRAGVQGSLTGGFTSGAPLPAVLAGALLARIGQSQPFPAVDADGGMTIRQSGRLYLGINDDNVSDNRGAFDVRVEVSRPRR